MDSASTTERPEYSDPSQLSMREESQRSPQIIFGAANLGAPGGAFGSDPQIFQAFELLQQYEVDQIDTAQRYGGGRSEEVLGRVQAGGGWRARRGPTVEEPAHHSAGQREGFVIDTKWIGGIDGPLHGEEIVNSAQRSLARLGIAQIDCFYMHNPDRVTPLIDTLAAINKVYEMGIFKRFGLSNYTAREIQEVYDTAKQNGYVLPTVYQGMYNPVARRDESDLFPLLRRLGISFYAYSPMAGGFLTKTKQQILDGVGRFSAEIPLQIFRKSYCKPSLLDALDEWNHIADDEGVSRAELAYRWTVYHGALRRNHGDGVIVGASNVDQLRQTLQGINRGPLSASAVARIEHIWQKVKHEAPGNTFELALSE